MVAYAAQWNDDLHHALHVLCTGERDGYYAEYAAQPLQHLGRALAEGFAWQGEASPYRRQAPRGEPSADLSPQSFVAFLQCHDQVGNRALGERIGHLAPEPALRAALAIVLLAPSIPLLFMGEEFAAKAPFQFFCDFSGVVSATVSTGRQKEFGRFDAYDVNAPMLPDPGKSATFLASKLDWSCLYRTPHSTWLAYYRELLKLRRERLLPHLRGHGSGGAGYKVRPPGGLRVRWRLDDGAMLWMLANLSDTTMRSRPPPGACIFASSDQAMTGILGPWSVVWTLQ